VKIKDFIAVCISETIVVAMLQELMDVEQTGRKSWLWCRVQSVASCFCFCSATCLSMVSQVITHRRFLAFDLLTLTP